MKESLLHFKNPIRLTDDSDCWFGSPKPTDEIDYFLLQGSGISFFLNNADKMVTRRITDVLFDSCATSMRDE